MRQLGLTIVAVIDDWWQRRLPARTVRLWPSRSPLRSERLDAVTLKVWQRTKMLFELWKRSGYLRQQVQTGAPDLGLGQISLLEEKAEKDGRAAARGLGQCAQELHRRHGQVARLGNECLLHRGQPLPPVSI